MSNKNILSDSFLDDLEDLERLEVAPAVLPSAEEEPTEVKKRFLGPALSYIESPLFALQLEKVRSKKKVHQDIESDSDSDSDDDDIDYEEINQAQQLVHRLDEGILELYHEVKEVYAHRFPALVDIIPSPLDYLKIVEAAGNASDWSSLPLRSELPASLWMTIQISLSANTGRLLEPSELKNLMDLCEWSRKLATVRKEILDDLETRMHDICINLCQIVGPRLACELILHAGNISQLAFMPSQNIMLLGRQTGPIKKIQFFDDDNSGPISADVSQISSQYGIISQSSIVRHCADPIKAIRLLSSKISRAAKIDVSRKSSDGEEGRRLHQEIFDELKKYFTVSSVHIKKPLPLPKESRSKKRGGKRHRAFKEKYGLSELRKSQNRMAFAEQEQTLDLEGMVGMGMIKHSTGTGSIRVREKKTRKPEIRNANALVRQDELGGFTTSLGISTTVDRTNQNFEASKTQNQETHQKIKKTFNSGYETVIAAEKRQAYYFGGF